MASAKMPPRQQMINMMYLVLTAMLAMNVSKEVLDAFAVLNRDLERSEQATAQRSLVEYAVLSDDAERIPGKYGPVNAKARRIKAEADSLVRDIHRLKADLMAEADGLELHQVRADDGTGRDTLRQLLALEAKDDRDVLTRRMVGGEPAAPHTRPLGAHDLKVRIARFRDTLKHLVGEAAPELQVSLDQLFDLADRRDASGTLNNWESINFYDVPLAAGVATLTKLQADIRHAEHDVLRWLHRSVSAGDHSFSRLTTAVIPQSDLVMLGDSFRADVFLAAYDPQNSPVVTLGSGTPIPVGADGKAKLRLSADVVGERQVQGTITVQGPDGPTLQSYTATYQVMAPLLVASPTKMNVLYRGVDNPIDLSVPGIPADRVSASITSGRITRAGQGWVASGMTASTVEVHATVSRPDGTTRRVGPVRFRVKDLPPPTAYIAGLDPSDTKAARSKLSASQGVVAKPIGAEFDDPWKVQRFQLSIVRKGGPPVFQEATGNAFTPEMLEVLDALRPGDQVFVDGIRARLSSGQGHVRDLAPIAVKVLP
ncbi:MAG: gliding motility protein GldM [Flavobacteriales bacterium]|jgi:gliding motility-associated protein GldM|nr:gliding motility protein GldM [Flavobacteriales bacterium]MBK9512262.1 gliding motility protein GldM [Flavobacteriales bacterium]MBP7448566.1 gliding motility protein GldM [Flavobacteriales bacterium]